MEQGLVPLEPIVVKPDGAQEIDGRGWLMVLVAMVLIGLWALRPSPAPDKPQPVLVAQSEPWMADALPGIGAKTRAANWQRIRSGMFEALPERARETAREVFIWPPTPPPTGSQLPPAR